MASGPPVEGGVRSIGGIAAPMNDVRDGTPKTQALGTSSNCGGTPADAMLPT